MIVRPSSPCSNQSEFVSTLLALLESRRLSSLRSPNHNSISPRLLRRRLPPLVAIEDVLWQRQKALTLASQVYSMFHPRSLARKRPRWTAPTMILPTLGRSKQVERITLGILTTVPVFDYDSIADAFHCVDVECLRYFPRMTQTDAQVLRPPKSWMVDNLRKVRDFELRVLLTCMALMAS